MPWIRNYLNLPPDDVEVVEYWEDRGLENEKITFEPHYFQQIICLGAGPNLLPELKSKINILRKPKIGIFSADGSTNLLLHYNLVPNAVITDLDGITENTITWLDKHQVPIYVLAHGDNYDKIGKHIEQLKNRKNIIWCTQGKPIHNWYNFLGFTDGDRAIALASRYTDMIYTLGFDLSGNFIGKYSKPDLSKNTPITQEKKIKLIIAKKIIQWLGTEYKIYTHNWNNCPGIELTFDEFIKI